ncbi:MAG TPA: hypothetical protein VLM37_06305 [Fibrobacteraceae bacterium]|nr:hypothetical protein [Fibrobacteraceae bacterium]
MYVLIPLVHVKGIGEAGYPSNVFCRPRKSIYWYISKSGGFLENSDQNRVMIRYANGSVSTAEDAKRGPDPGSMIIASSRKVQDCYDFCHVMVDLGYGDGTGFFGLML